MTTYCCFRVIKLVNLFIHIISLLRWKDYSNLPIKVLRSGKIFNRFERKINIFFMSFSHYFNNNFRKRPTYTKAHLYLCFTGLFLEFWRFYGNSSQNSVRFFTCVWTLRYTSKCTGIFLFFTVQSWCLCTLQT